MKHKCFELTDLETTLQKIKYLKTEMEKGCAEIKIMHQKCKKDDTQDIVLLMPLYAR